jgi:4-hydroxy-tetrahydrodipicolinate synthase
LFLASNPIPTKWLHHHLGEIQTVNLRAPLTATDLTATEKVLHAHTTVQNWLKVRSSL